MNGGGVHHSKFNNTPRCIRLLDLRSHPVNRNWGTRAKEISKNLWGPGLAASPTRMLHHGQTGLNLVNKRNAKHMQDRPIGLPQEYSEALRNWGLSATPEEGSAGGALNVTGWHRPCGELWNML